MPLYLPSFHSFFYLLRAIAPPRDMLTVKQVQGSRSKEQGSSKFKTAGPCSLAFSRFFLVSAPQRLRGIFGFPVLTPFALLSFLCVSAPLRDIMGFRETRHKAHGSKLKGIQKRRPPLASSHSSLCFAPSRDTGFASSGTTPLLGLLFGHDVADPAGVGVSFFAGRVDAVTFAGFFVGAFPVDRGAGEAGFQQ